MDVYFVRHGETDGNVARRHQHQDTELNELGKEQAQSLVDFVTNLKSTQVITSTNLRAVETTRILISGCEDIIPITHSAFEEIKKPSWLIGNRYISFVTAWYIWRWFFGMNIKGDGEDYEGFLQRIIEARNYLENLPPDSRVIVVSHSVFINLFLEHLCSDKKISVWWAFVRLLKILLMKNAVVTHLQYQNNSPKCGWRVVEN